MGVVKGVTYLSTPYHATLNFWGSLCLYMYICVYLLIVLLLSLDDEFTSGELKGSPRKENFLICEHSFMYNVFIA